MIYSEIKKKKNLKWNFFSNPWCELQGGVVFLCSGPKQTWSWAHLMTLWSNDCHILSSLHLYIRVVHNPHFLESHILHPPEWCVWPLWAWQTKFFWDWTIFEPPPTRLKFYLVNLLHSEPDFFSSWQGHMRKVFWSSWIFHQSLPNPMVDYMQNFMSIRWKLDPPAPSKGSHSIRSTIVANLLFPQ